MEKARLRAFFIVVICSAPIAYLINNALGTLLTGMEMTKLIKTSSSLVILLMFAACAPEVGSEEWCEDMDETVKGDWTANDAREYARSCVFRRHDDD